MRWWAIPVAACAMVAAADGASADTKRTDFIFTTHVNASVTADKTTANGKLPYVDQDAVKGRLDGSVGVQIAGYFDPEQITAAGGGETVMATITSFSADAFGYVLYQPAANDFATPVLNISRSAAGLLTLSFQAPDLLYDLRQTTSVFAPTVLTANLTPQLGSTALSSLTQTGGYYTLNSAITDLYGVRDISNLTSIDDPQVVYRAVDGLLNYATTDAYLVGGADVVNGRAYMGTNDGGSFTLFQFRAPDPIGPTAVPEPATWSMLIAGFGVVGAGLRRRLRTASRLAFG